MLGEWKAEDSSKEFVPVCHFDTLPWGDTIPLEVPIPSGDLYIDSLSTVSCRQLVNDENPASDSFHPAQMNFERLMAMERNAADIAPVPLFINLEVTNPASVAGNDQTEAEHDPILSCLNSPEPPGPVFGILTDISGSAILPDLPCSNFNPGNSILPDTPETNSHPDFGTLLDPPDPKIDADTPPLHPSIYEADYSKSCIDRIQRSNTEVTFWFTVQSYIFIFSAPSNRATRDTATMAKFHGATSKLTGTKSGSLYSEAIHGSL